MNRLLRLTPLIFVLFAAPTFTACGGRDASGLAPDFSLASPGGATTTLSGQKGKVVLVNFWATWCDSCKEELPILQELQRTQAGDRFKLLAVAVDDDPTKVAPFAASHGMTFPVLYADRKTMDAYAVRLLPTSYLIAPDGTIARRYVGPLDERAVENDILSLLSTNRRPS